MTTPRDGVPVIPGQTAVDLPERDASEVMSPAEEAELIEVIEESGPEDFVEVTRPEGTSDYDPRDCARRFMQDEVEYAATSLIRDLFEEEWADLPRKVRDARALEIRDLVVEATVALSWPDAP